MRFELVIFYYFVIFWLLFLEDVQHLSVEEFDTLLLLYIFSVLFLVFYACFMSNNNLLVLCLIVLWRHRMKKLS